MPIAIIISIVVSIIVLLILFFCLFRLSGLITREEEKRDMEYKEAKLYEGLEVEVITKDNKSYYGTLMLKNDIQISLDNSVELNIKDIKQIILLKS